MTSVQLIGFILVLPLIFIIGIAVFIWAMLMTEKAVNRLIREKSELMFAAVLVIVLALVGLLMMVIG